MAKGGTIAIVHQPRNPGSTDKDTQNAGSKFFRILLEAGFEDIRVEEKVMKPVPAICLLGINK